MPVPFFDIKRQIASIRPALDKAISEVVDSGAFILGPKVVELEKYAAQHLGVKHAIGVASGTDALMLALKALSIGPDDEVITSPFTFVATAEAISYCGAKPVFIDIESKSYNIDASKIEEKITRKTKAILPVHLYGHPCDMKTIMSLAKKHNLNVIEDCAQAIGAKFEEEFVGSIGDAGCFSFFPTKNLGCFGDGGLITTNSDNLSEMARVLRGHGSKTTYHYDYIGYNSRLDSIQAAIILARFHYLEQWTNARRKNASHYSELLSNIDEITLPTEAQNVRHVYNQFTIRARKRDGLFEHLKSKQTGAMVYYPLSLHLQKAFLHLGCKKGDFAESESAQESVISLPIFPELKKEEIEEACLAIRNFYGKG